MSTEREKAAEKILAKVAEMEWIDVKQELPPVEQAVLVEIVVMPSQSHRRPVTVRWEGGPNNHMEREYFMPAPPTAVAEPLTTPAEKEK